MKGSHADLRNSAGRSGGANTAAAFLSQFVGDVQRWAHLDIAGVANVEARERRTLRRRHRLRRGLDRALAAPLAA